MKHKFSQLVLGRKFGEGVELCIDGEVVAVVRVENNRAGSGVRLAVYAPHKVKIARVGGRGEPDLTT